MRFGGKKEIPRYPGHDFFRKWIKPNKIDRGEVRQLCAQIGMLYFEDATNGNWLDIGTQPLDDFYYRNLGFDINSTKVTAFSNVLDLINEIFDGYKCPKFKGHEAIHLILLMDVLMKDYTKAWQSDFTKAFDFFREQSAISKKDRNGDYWFLYGALTQTQSSNAKTIELRHGFFVQQMYSLLNPIKKDEMRGYGQLEREIVYYRDKKKCTVCGVEINWSDLEIHHVNEHQHGGRTTLENGVAVHSKCHPKGHAATTFYEDWKKRSA